MRIVVFDFDKTLIKGDSLTQLFLKESLRKPLGLIYFFLLVFLYKIGTLSNTFLKYRMLIFLFNDEAHILKSIENNIKFNKTVVLDILKYHIEQGDCCIISTASLDTIVLKFLNIYSISNSNVILSPSTLSFPNDKLILNNNFGVNKLHELSKIGFDKFDILFTDDLHSDKYLVHASKKIFHIKSNIIKSL